MPAAVALALLLFGANSSARAQSIQFRQLTPNDGLSSSLVESIIQDSRGFLWLGTKKGVNRYDGYGFAVYRHRTDDSTSLIDNEASTLYEDSRQTIWVGTPVGLSRYDRDRDAFQSYAVVPGDTVAVSAIVEANGTLWLGTPRGLYTFDRASGTATPYSPALTGFDIRGLFLDSRHRLWLGGKTRGAFELEPTTGRMTSWITERDVRQFVEDDDGALYAAMMDGGLAKIDRRAGRVVVFKHDASNPASLAIDARWCIRYIVIARSLRLRAVCRRPAMSSPHALSISRSM